MVGVVQWGLLPSDVLISIFSHLKRRDRLSCSMVCSKWKYAMGAPNLWHHMSVYLDTDLMEPSTMMLTRDYHMYIRSLEFGWSKPQTPPRWMPHKLQEVTKRACRYLIVLTEKYVQVRTIKLHAWYELTRLKKIIYHLSLFLKSQLSLTNLCFCNALLNKSDFMKLLVACRNSEDVVSQLDIRNCFYHFEVDVFSVQFMACMEQFGNLSLLKVDYSTFRREVRQVLLGGKNKNLRRLEIHTQNDDVVPVSDEEWWEINQKLQGLNVALIFTNITSIDGVLSVLQKSIPLQTLTLATARCWHNHNQNGCHELFRVLTRFYKRTLEFLDVRFHDNIDLPDRTMLGVVEECKKLKSFRFSGVVGNPDVIREMCKVQVEQNACKHVELAVRHLNCETQLSMIKLYQDLDCYRREKKIDFKMHNTKFRNLLVVYKLPVLDRQFANH